MTTKTKHMKTTGDQINAGCLRLSTALAPDNPPSDQEQGLESQVQSPPGAKCPVRHGEPAVQGSKGIRRPPAAVTYLSRFLCAGFALALLVTGCAGPRPLKGGRAITTHKPTGVIEQTLVQGENASQPTKQDQATIKVRTYTVPAGSRIEQASLPAFQEPQYERNALLSPSLIGIPKLFTGGEESFGISPRSRR